MKILDRLPIPDRPHLITLRDEVVQVHRHQIIIWLSVNNPEKPMPAIRDTGTATTSPSPRTISIAGPGRRSNGSASWRSTAPE